MSEAQPFHDDRQDTPLTNAKKFKVEVSADGGYAWCVHASFARELESKLSAPSETASRDAVIEECAKVCERARFRITSGPHKFAPVEGVGEHFAQCLRALKNAAPQEARASDLSQVAPPVWPESRPGAVSDEAGSPGGSAAAAPSVVASTESIGAAWLKDDLTYMKEPLVNARTGEEVKGEVRWTVWWNGPDAATFREALALSASSSWERK